jgi:hypothetical protein
MKRIVKAFLVFSLLLWLGSASCSSGSKSGGGGETVTPGNGESTPVTYTAKDLKGTWSWTADRQNAPLRLSGTLTFGDDLRVEGWETDYCPGRQIYTYAQFWLWEDGYVKGRNPSFCDFPLTEMKFSMDFVTASAKKRIQGLLDIHQIDPATWIDSYERFDITLTKRE